MAEPPASVPGAVGLSGVHGGGGASNAAVNSSRVNSRRISAVIDRLSALDRNQLQSNAVEFSNLCLSLSRGVDYGIVNNDIPSRARELPSLVKLVCQLKVDAHLLGAIMVLLISVKNACQSGWFSDKDSKELESLVKEIANYFGSLSLFTADPEPSSVITTIMSRFYPRMKIGRMFGFLEVKPGFDAYVADFQILKNLNSSPGGKIRLFVVQTDNIETSSCLVSPPNVNFLLNGKGVERRTSLYMDTGPQIPTAVTHLLKYGSNLLQAVGEFNGNYIIAVAIVTEMPNLDCIDALQDYEQLTPDTVDSDSEIIEGSSRISLNCPISFTRIKTPVKGHSCKHIQCFDFDNYVDINSRRPSWRCPHCNQHVCFTDIRIDQKMVKILKEVEPNVSNIIVSSEGTWNAAMDNGDAVQQPKEKTAETEQHESSQDLDLLDLTLTDDIMDDVTTCATEDKKLTENAGQPQNTAVNPLIANTNNVSQSSAHDVDGFWSGLYLSTFGQGLSNEGVSVSSVLTDSFTTSGDFEAFNSNDAHATTSMETSLPSTMQLPQQQFGNTTIPPEYGRFPSFARNVTRTPAAVQALPALVSPSVQRTSRNVHSFIQSGLSVASQQMQSSTLPRYPGVQQNHPSAQFHSVGLPPQQNNFQASNRVPNQQMTNLGMPPAMVTQLPGPIQSSMQQQMQTPVSYSMRPQTHVAVPPQAAAYSMNQRSFAGAASASQPLARTDTYDPNQQHNWHPAGRMRGALSGQAYEDALNRFIIRPSQQAQATRPVQPNYPSAGSANLPNGSGILPY